MRLCMVNLSSHGASEREGETQQQKQAENRRWFIVTGLLVERESHSWADQWQLAARKAQECRERLAEPRPILFFFCFYLFCHCRSCHWLIFEAACCCCFKWLDTLVRDCVCFWRVGWFEQGLNSWFLQTCIKMYKTISKTDVKHSGCGLFLVLYIVYLLNE